MNSKISKLITVKRKSHSLSVSTIGSFLFKLIIISLMLKSIESLHFAFDFKIGELHITTTNTQIPQGCRTLTSQENQLIKKQLNGKTFRRAIYDQSEEFLEEGSEAWLDKIITENKQVGSVYGRYVFTIKPNKFWLRISEQNLYSQMLLQREWTILPIGLAVIVPMKEQVPKGFRMMNFQQVYEYKEQIRQILDNWSVVAFEDGKIDGKMYGNKISSSYGAECGQMLIIFTQKI